MKSNESNLEAIITSFERLCGWWISFHDYAGRLEPCLRPIRTNHMAPNCAAAKIDAEPQCVAFDKDLIQSLALQRPGGFFKICHAGIVERAVPLREGTVISGMMFVGLFRWEEATIPDDFVVSEFYDHANRWQNDTLANLAPLNAAAAEGVRHVAATLKSHLENALQAMPLIQTGENPLRDQIEGYVRYHLGEPISLTDAAEQVNLSASRLGHKIKECFGMTFPDLVSHHRIDLAKSLLRLTRLSIRDVSERCGFTDVGYFHKVFKKREGMTPGAYRRASLNPRGV